MRNISSILVCGAGMMGKNIAFIFTKNLKYDVVVYDINQVDVKADIRHQASSLIESGLVKADELEERLNKIYFTTDLDDKKLLACDLVVEAVFEDMAIKQETFRKLEERLGEDVIFCTNSSVMSPSEISEKLIHRERFIGTHFWNPAHLIPLVEVIKSDASSDEVADRVMEILKEVGKEAVLCKKDVPGFIANRLQHALWREAISIVENGIADAKTVDKAIKYSFGMRLPQLGPMENADMVGVDLTYQIHDYLLRDLEDSHLPSKLLSELIERKDLGFKSGKGFQEWTKEDQEKVKSDLNEYLVNVLKSKGRSI